MGKVEGDVDYRSAATTNAGRRSRGAPTVAAAGSWDPNLLLDFEETAKRLRARLTALRSHEDVFDAFLLAGCLHQILEDHLHRDVYSLGRVAEHLPRAVRSDVARPLAGAALALRAGAIALRARQRRERLLIGWQRDHAAFVRHLAAAVVDGTAPIEVPGESIAHVEGFPADLRATIGRLPHCFRSFDQRPTDLARLVDSFATRWPDRTIPLVIVGLRTAGSYLAPLAAAFLARRGYRQLNVLTTRPGQDWLDYQLAALRGGRDPGSLVLVVDEPPRSGSQFVQAASELEAQGVRRDSLVLLVPLFSSTLPPALCSYQTVVLPWSDWAIHDRLEPEAVKADLRALRSGYDVEHVERVHPSAVPTAPRRGHTMGVFRVGLVDKASGDRRDEYVAAEGAGIGYLGRHALSVANRLRDFLPTVYGLRDGLLYRAWLPEQWRQTPRDDERLAARMASYVVARKHALAVSEDTTRRLIGRDTATDLVARMISEAFGKGSLPARPLVQGVARRLLETAHPSVIDGSMTLQHWFAPSGDWGAAQKVDFHTRAFSNEDRYCYDAVYDLACAAASGRSGALANALVSAYEDLAGEPVEPERWLLYQLLHHHQTERPKAVAEGDIARFVACERAMALAHQLYFAGVFFSDLPVPTSGPLCAIDVDWVLEVRWLGFPAISPASALALRMLARHGYRPTIATGRSLAEMQRRCESYRLAGGVAEYGAVVYDHASRRTRSLLSGSDHAALAELAERLSSIPGVYVEPGRKHSVRAFRLQRGGTVGLDEATIRTALSGVSSRDRLRPIRARSQTDFVIADVDKGIGVRALAEELGGARLALSVGDSIDDLPMLRLAERAAAPSNADAALSRVVSSGDAVIQRASHPYGSGLLEVVSDVVGHPRRTCPTCAAPQGSGSASALMLTALAALDGGARKKARQAAILSSRLALLRLAAVAPITPSPQLRGRAGRNGRARFASE